MTRNKIAFVCFRAQTLVNRSVCALLSEQFPQYDVVTIDLRVILPQKPFTVLVNLLFVFKEYGRDILKGHKKVERSFFRTTFFFRSVRKIVLSRLADSSYVFSFQTQSLFDGSRPGIPHFVYTDHTHLTNLAYPDFKRSQLYSQAWIDLEKTIYQHADIIFTKSTHVSRSLVEEYGCKPERIVCAYVFSISDPNHPKPNVEKYSSKNILFVGIDWERKGGPDLVEAFRSVLRVHPDARLTIVGCTPRIDLPNCTVVGRIPIDQVSQHYSQAAVFCMPTKAEPFGIVFVEAMMRRLPIVSTNIGALPDIVSHGINGYLVKTGDSVELAKHLTDLVGNPTLCKHMGESSYRKASERYTRQNVGATLKRNIERVLNGRAREHTTEFSSISES